MFRKNNLNVTSICRFLVGIAFMVMIVTVLIQVFGRLTGNSPVWTEELSRFALLYLAAFGAGLSLVSGDLVSVDVVCESLPGQWPRRFRLLSAFLSAVLCLMLLYPAWKYMLIGRMQTSPALGLRVDFVHVTILLMVSILLFFSLQRIFGMLFKGESGLPNHLNDH